MTWLAKRLRTAWHDEGGTASLEFVLSIPVLVAIFSASFESGLFMTRAILLEQSVDMVMRELRLGHYPIPTPELLKQEICKRTIILADCKAKLKLDFIEVDTAAFILPTEALQCVDQPGDPAPPVVLEVGQENDLMLMRACIVQDALYPTTGIGLKLTKDEFGGGYAIATVSAFANEPTS